MEQSRSLHRQKGNTLTLKLYCTDLMPSLLPTTVSKHWRWQSYYRKLFSNARDLQLGLRTAGAVKPVFNSISDLVW